MENYKQYIYKDGQFRKVIDGGVDVPVEDVKVNGSTVVSNKVANIEVPTKTSDLTNDSGFITASDIPAQKTKLSEFTDDLGNNPIHTHSQYITEHQSLAGYATESWVESQGYSTFSGSYNDLTNKPALKTVATTGSYNDLINKPTIPAAQIQSDWSQTDTAALDYIKNKPTNVSAFTNDAGYLTSHQSLADYATNSSVDTKIANAITNALNTNY